MNKKSHTATKAKPKKTVKAKAKTKAKGKTKSKAKSTKTKQTPLIIKTTLSIIAVFVVGATAFKIFEFLTTTKPENPSIFPKANILLSNATIEQINANTKDIKYQNNTLTFTTNETFSEFSNVEIKGRGNFTWGQIKKPYQIKFEEKESLFDHEEAKKWILLANYTDPTHLRNDTALYLEKMLNMNYAINGNFLELYFDDNYNGLYYLTEKVEIAKSRINLKDPNGILVELDNIYGQAEGCHPDYYGNCLVIKDSVNTGNSDLSMQLFIEKLNEAELAIEKQDYDKISELIDTESFAKYYLISDFSSNPDAYTTSFFLYMDGENDKIHAGPGWDFDLAFGNKLWPSENPNTDIILSPTETMVLKNFTDRFGTPYISHISTLLFKLMDIPEFKTEVGKVYRETLYDKKDDLLNHIKSQADYIRDAALHDKNRWKLKTDFEEEVNYLTNWIAEHYDYLDQIYNQN